MKLLIHNGPIWTGNSRQPWADALLIENGIIAAIGTRQEASVWPQPAEVLDLQGHLALPGFIDNHMHPIWGGMQLIHTDLREVSQKEFVDKIVDKASQLPRGQWILGGSWDHERWPGKTLPHRAWIDPFTPDHPVFVTRLDLHMGLANSLALRLAGIDAHTESPPGGVIEKDPLTGEPTGILKDAAMGLIDVVIPPPTDTDYDHMTLTALQHAAAYGITSVQTVPSDQTATAWREWASLQRLHQQGLLPIRVYARLPLGEAQAVAAYVKKNHSSEDFWLRLGGIKGFVDGSLGACTALFFHPYLDNPNTAGLYTEQMLPASFMKDNVSIAVTEGISASVHAIGDKAVHELIDLFAEVLGEVKPPAHLLRIEHAQHVLPNDIRPMKELGLQLSMQPCHLLDDAPWSLRRLGESRCQTAFPLRSLLNAGVFLSFGTDWPVAPIDPLRGLYAAVTRSPLDNSFPEGWIPEEKISLEQALSAYTIGSAHAEGSAAQKGSLEVGKLADITVLSRNILHLPPEALLDTSIIHTIVGGKLVYSAT